MSESFLIGLRNIVPKILLLLIVSFPEIGCGKSGEIGGFPKVNEGAKINVMADYFVESFQKIDSDGFEGIKFQTDKKTAEILLKSKHPNILEHDFGLQYLKDTGNCSVTTVMTFHNDGPLISVEVAAICNDLASVEELNKLYNILISTAGNRFGPSWHESSAPKTIGHYALWKTKSCYLAIANTPERRFERFYSPFSISLWTRDGMPENIYRTEMKNTFGF